jgi:type IV secretory pathway VirB3-like protein
MYVEMLDFEFIFLEIVSIQIQNLWYLSVMLHVLYKCHKPRVRHWNDLMNVINLK